jgi:aryl-alcohol dehydrogenase-like predicted oxidoreductase
MGFGEASRPVVARESGQAGGTRPPAGGAPPAPRAATRGDAQPGTIHVGSRRTIVRRSRGAPSLGRKGGEMRYRSFGRNGWRVGEVGYGMWGMGGWTGSDDVQSRLSLEAAVARGVNFFDTAQSYGDGHSELLLGRLMAVHPDKRLYTATKVPPRNQQWPSRQGVPLAEVFPRDYVRRCVDISCANLGVETIGLLQLHVWEDDWLADGDLQRTVAELRKEGSIRAFGLSLNRWQPWNGVKAVQSGLVDSVQVVYNIFDQAPEDELFPACREHGVAVIARAPFDEGSLTGTLTLESKWPADDWRNGYFAPASLAESVKRVDALRPLVPAGTTMAQMALRFILSNPDVGVVIPGMRRIENVEMNTAAAEMGPLPPDLLAELRKHRWDRPAIRSR